MKNKLIISIIIFILLVTIKYCFSNYKIEYEVNNYHIKAVYKNKRFYYEIKDDDKVYNFDIYGKSYFKKQFISDIKIIEDESFKCIYPVIKNEKTYPLCYVGGEFTDYNLIDSILLLEYKTNYVTIEKNNKDFVYYNNLNDNEYVALWNYKGYIVMNNKSYESVDLFNKDKYDNSLAYIIDNKIIMPNNDQEHEFNSLVIFNIKNKKKEIFELKYTIDYDSYIVGNIGNKLYLFDNKHSILYEINVKKEEIDIIGNNEKGYVKYENGKFVSCSKTEYKNDKIKYGENSNTNYHYDKNNGIYKSINDNKNIKQKIINKEVNIIKEDRYNLFYQYDDNFYKYSPIDGSQLVFYNYELKYNKDNIIFVYID